ncbi:InlB B-repeat-containing protein [Alishewanella sp. d11]|uniref:InlB B-repeat-containing protein n=1 Tax=Alishewanella sp. d11 TaxID=3414030 RepID=UPI003BF79067
MKTKFLLFAALVLSGLTACGGGGGGSAAPQTFTIQIGNFTGGRISPATITVSAGQTATFTVTADTGFELVSVSGCGGTLSGNTYRTGPIATNCSITATFNRLSYAVSAAAGNGGSITPALVNVQHGETTAFDVTANTGFSLASVTGCGGTLSGTRFTTAPITSACSVNASFSALTFTVQTQVQGSGVITPAEQVANFNQQLTFTLKPEAGYTVASATGCGGTLQGLEYVTAPITAACTVNVSFEPAMYTLSATSSGGGAITPATITLAAGGRAEFTLQPDNGFRFKQLDGCTGYFEDNKFIVENVTADCAIVAQFNNAENIEFADVRLAQAVRSALGLSASQAITAARVAQLTSLNAAGRDIARLDGLQYATALQFLDISNNRISNFSVLNLLSAQSPTNLTALYIGRNPAAQLPDFRQFSALRNLSLANLELSRLPQLAGLTQLNFLNIRNNRLTELTELTSLPIADLYLNSNPLPDDAFSVLATLPLKTLHVDDTDFTSAERISMLNLLQDFSANYTLLSNLTALQGLSNLRTLSIYGTQVFDIKPLLSLFPTNNGAVYLGGCLKTQGFARATAVITELQGRGNFVQVYDWAVPFNTGCSAGENLIQDLAVSAVLDNNGLRLDWSLNSTDEGPWRCELHFNLGQQQPRVPAKVLENCHLQRSWLISDINLDIAEPHLIIDNGLFRTWDRADAGVVVNAAGLPDPYLHSSDWLQIVVKNNPFLVPNREAKLRLHVLSSTNAAPPPVQAWLIDAGIRTPLAVAAPARLPTQKQAGNLSESYLITLPAAAAKSGIQVAYAIGGQAERLIEPQFAAVNSIDLTVVPFQLGETITTPPTNSLIENSILTVWPFASVNVINRQPYRLTTAPDQNSNSTMLGELFDLRAAEGGRSFYYGYYTRDMNSDGFAGMAYRPGTSGVGVVPFGQIDYILSHELGHNLNLQHAPCGDPSGIDPNYPYANGLIGTWGVPLSFNSLLSPTIYRDVMSYCNNEHVSDYNLELVQDYITERQDSPALHLRLAGVSAAVTTSATMARSLGAQPAMFYRFELNDAAVPTVLQAMQITRLPEARVASRFRVLAEFSQGAPLPIPVEKLTFGHGDSPEQISFAVPLTSSGGQLLAWSLFDGQRLLHHEQMPQASATAANTLAASGIRVEERAGQVCVVIPSQADGVNLLLQQQDQTMVMALNESTGQFCRDTSNIPSGGSWQVQTRRGLAVQSHSFPR